MNSDDYALMMYITCTLQYVIENNHSESADAEIVQTGDVLYVKRYQY